MKQNEFERVIIKALYSNAAVCSKVLPELKTSWFFDIDCKMIAEHILNFNTKFSRMPNVLETKKLMNDETVLACFEQCMEIPNDEVNTDYILSEIEEFVRKKLMYNASENIQRYVTQGIQQQGSFADALADAESFCFDTNIGFDFFGEAKRLYEDANTKERIFKTGVKTLDDLIGGGLHEKSLNLIMSATNVGKTLIMCSLTTNFVQNGYKVLYVTFEDSENKIATRIAQNMFDLTQTQYKAMSQEEFGKAFLFAKKKCGGNNLRIKEYPEGTVNAMMIKSLLKDLDEKQGFKPDVLVIDYIGCMIPNGKPNPNLNTNTLLLNVAMQVRAIGMEFGIPVLSASQTNRGGYGVAEISLSDAADSFGQNMKADAVFGITQSAEFKEQGMYSVQLLKTRYGNQRGQITSLGVDIEKQRIYDLNNNNYQQSKVNVFDAVKQLDTDSVSGTGTDLSDVDIDF